MMRKILAAVALTLSTVAVAATPAQAASCQKYQYTYSASAYCTSGPYRIRIYHQCDGYYVNTYGPQRFSWSPPSAIGVPIGCAGTPPVLTSQIVFW